MNNTKNLPRSIHSSDWGQFRSDRDRIQALGHFVYRLFLPLLITGTLVYLFSDMSPVQSRATLLMWTAWTLSMMFFHVDAVFLKLRIGDAFKNRRAKRTFKFHFRTHPHE